MPLRVILEKMGFCGRAGVFSLVLLVAILAGSEFSTPAQEPKLPRPLEEIIRHFAQKEAEYARAHALYAYRLTIKLQELGANGNVLGEFNETLAVSRSPTGRRIDRVVEEPKSSLQHLAISRLELFDLRDVPLFTVSPEDLHLYQFDYLGPERVDEVDTFVFRVAPTAVRSPRPLFEGLLWVDAEKLDVVKAFGRTLPTHGAGVLKDYFPRVEIYREPVGEYLFPTYIQGNDVLRVVGETVHARMILRFSQHELIAPSPALTPQP